MKSRLLLTLFFVLSLGMLPLHAQEPTPSSLPPLEPITAANAAQLKELAEFADAEVVSPDGERAVLTVQGNQQILIDVSDSQQVAVLGTDVGGLQFDAKGTVLKAVVDNALDIWDVLSGKLLSTITSPLGDDAADTDMNFIDTVFSPDGHTIRAYFTDGTSSAVLWDTASGKQKFRIDVDETFYQVAFSPDSRLIALYDSTDGVSVWDIVSQKPFARIETPYFNLAEGSHMEVDFSPDSAALVLETVVDNVGEDLHTVWTAHIVDLNTQREVGVYQGIFQRFSESGKDAIISSDTAINFYNVSSGIKEKSIPIAPYYNVLQIAFNADGSRMGYAERDESVVNGGDLFVLWNITGSAPFNIAIEGEPYIRGIYFNPQESGLVLISIGDQSYTWFKDAVTGEDINVIPGDVLQFSADGTRLFIADWGNNIQVWGVPKPA